MSAFGQLWQWLINVARECFENLLEIPGFVVNSHNRFFWLYLTSFLLLALIVQRFYRLGDWRGKPLNRLRWIFPKEMYLHPSAVLDYKLFLANRMLTPGGRLSRLLLGSLSIALVADWTESALRQVSGVASTPYAFEPWSLVVLTLYLALIRDFATYAVHALHHRNPLLWEFHKVHHSAEVLTPITLYRKHPVYTFLSRATDIVLVGPLQGLVAFLFAGDVQLVTLFGANAVFTLFHLLGSNLRHSHIWLSFGPYVSHILLSPAQHQIHHSKARSHWNKNFGEVFALWDWLFGTLYVPRHHEQLEFGIAGESHLQHGTLARAYLVPFRNIGKRLRVARLDRPSPPAEGGNIEP